MTWTPDESAAIHDVRLRITREEYEHKGYLRGLREAAASIRTYIGPEPRDFTAHRDYERGKDWAREQIKRLIAAAEREQNGGTDEQR